MAQIVWQDRAVDDFESIQHYLEENYGEYQVRKFTKHVFNVLELLSQYPNMGSIQNDDLDIRGFVISSQTTLLYKPHNTQVHILAFFDNRSNPFLFD